MKRRVENSRPIHYADRIHINNELQSSNLHLSHNQREKDAGYMTKISIFIFINRAYDCKELRYNFATQKSCFCEYAYRHATRFPCSDKANRSFRPLMLGRKCWYDNLW